MSDVVTAGVDVGTSAVKAALVTSDPKTGKARLLATYRERLLRRDPGKVAETCYVNVRKAAGLELGQISYVASTGEGDAVSFRDGHFYGMTTHARGAAFLIPGTRAVADLGALHGRAMVIDDTSRVLGSRMTSQCASGTGQFVENIARYLGVRLDEVGPISLAAQRSEVCSGICAVLAETDVINMVSRGIAVGEILRGIHESIAQRLAKLLRVLKATSPVVLTGGLANDVGLRGALERCLVEDGGGPLEVQAHPDSAFAGAIGAALWAAYRQARLAERGTEPNPPGKGVSAAIVA